MIQAQSHIRSPDTFFHARPQGSACLQVRMEIDTIAQILSQVLHSQMQCINHNPVWDRGFQRNVKKN